MVTKNYVALGDSISTGFGLQEKENAFTNLLKSSLNKGHNFYNYAVDGNTSDDLVGHLSEDEVIQNIKDADLITITIGGNDILHLLRTYKELLNIEFLISINDFEEVLNNPVVLLTIKEALSNIDLQTPFANMLENYESNLTLVIHKIKEVNENAKILVQTVYNPSDGIEKLKIIANLIDKFVSSINNIILEHQEGNYEVVDTYTAFKGKSAEFTNINLPDIHPNINGHKKIYHMIYEKVVDSQPFNIHIY